MIKFKWLPTVVVSMSLLAIAAACSTSESSANRASPGLDVSTRLDPAVESLSPQPAAAGCNITVHTFGNVGRTCPACEDLKARLPTLQAKFPCATINIVPDNPLQPGAYYPFVEPWVQGGTNYVAYDGVLRYLTANCNCGATMGGTGTTVDAGPAASNVCMCARWILKDYTGNGYSCAQKPASIMGELPPCTDNSQCSALSALCGQSDPPNPPAKCRKIECSGTPVVCKDVPVNNGKECNGECSKACSIDPFTGEQICEADCSDPDCCFETKCAGAAACVPPKADAGTDASTTTLTPTTSPSPSPY
jgi:hypothetical protein